MARVLTVVGGYPDSRITGAERMAWRTTAALAELGHDVAVLTDTPCPPDLAGRHWPVFRTPERIRGGREWPYPELVHVYDVASGQHARLGYELTREFGADLLVTPASAPPTWPDPPLARELCLASRALFALTASEVTWLSALGVPDSRIHRIPQAADLTGAGDGGAFRARYGVAGPLVLFLGRRVSAKGYQLLLEAAPRVWKVVPQTVFAFGGPGSGTQAAETFARHRDSRVLDLGELTEADKHDALAACDLLCLPSSADVFPLVVTEAWTCGKPVVTGQFAGVEDVVRDGVDGLVSELTADQVAAAVLRLLSDRSLRLRLGTAGQARVRAGMTWSDVAAVVEQSFSPAGRRPGRRLSQPAEEA